MASSHKLSFVDKKLAEIKKEDLYRKLRPGQIIGAKIKVGKKTLLNLCSNDYLGIPVSKIQTKQLQSSSRLVSGDAEIFHKLEKKLAKHKSQENGLIFPTGYMANLGAISTIINRNDLILSDELNHASIIESCRLSRGKISVYRHNNMEDLKKKIRKKSKRKFIITEGVFSMDGDHSKLKEISEIAKKENAIVILDDAHGDFVVGNDGKGSAAKQGVSKKIDLYISSLSKGLGSFGGYIASKQNVIDLCINKSKTFIYTSALPSTLVEFSLKRFDSNREKQRKKLWKNIELFSSEMKNIGFEIDSPTQIIPIIIGREKTTLEFGKFLFDNGVYAQPIRYPTVKRNKARIRVSITALLNSKQINDSVQVFEAAGKKFKIL